MALRKYSKCIGPAFQVVDVILDVSATTQVEDGHVAALISFWADCWQPLKHRDTC